MGTGWEVEAGKISAEMSSRKLLVLDFIRRFFARWGHSPTLSEIAAATGISRVHAQRLVHELDIEGFVHVVPGKTRGIRLLRPVEQMSESEVLAHLSSLGWTIGEGARVVQPAADVTKTGLHTLPFLDFKEADERGDS